MNIRPYFIVAAMITSNALAQETSELTTTPSAEEFAKEQLCSDTNSRIRVDLSREKTFKTAHFQDCATGKYIDYPCSTMFLLEKIAEVRTKQRKTPEGKAISKNDQIQYFHGRMHYCALTAVG